MSKQVKKTTLFSSLPMGGSAGGSMKKVSGIAEKIQKVVSGVASKGKETVATVAKGTVAVEEGRMNILKGNSLEKTVADFSETVKAGSVKEVQKILAGHHGKQTGTGFLRQTTIRGLVANIIYKEIFSVIVPGNKCENAKGRDGKYARFAAHSYGDLEDDVLPCGFRLIDARTTDENLRACAYSDDNEIVCAFAGTDMLNATDWKNNVTQLFGASKQYEEALSYAKSLSRRYPDKKIVFVGHSKGGGEAAYCAYNLGMPAETYNPAALSFFTKRKAKCKDGARINAYVFDTDILNALQANWGISVDGDVSYHRANALKHGVHGILGILKYYKIEYTKKKREK